GALYRSGISVKELARSKQIDMRNDFSCWLSKPIVGASGFHQILCIESGWNGTPPESTDNLFRALAPVCISTFPNGSVAMPIIGAGNQRWPTDRMLESILRAAASWLQRGLSIRVLKIVALSNNDADVAKRKFQELQGPALEGDLRRESPDDPDGTWSRRERENVGSLYDVFVSYSHEDAAAAKTVVDNIKRWSTWRNLDRVNIVSRRRQVGK